MYCLDSKIFELHLGETHYTGIENIETISKFLEQAREKIQRKYYSFRTEQAYLHWIKEYLPLSIRISRKGVFGRHTPRFRAATNFNQTQAITPEAPAGESSRQPSQEHGLLFAGEAPIHQAEMRHELG